MTDTDFPKDEKIRKTIHLQFLASYLFIFTFFLTSISSLTSKENYLHKTLLQFDSAGSAWLLL